MAVCKNQACGVSIQVKMSIGAHKFAFDLQCGTKEFLAWGFGLLTIYLGRVPDGVQSLLGLLRR